AGRDHAGGSGAMRRSVALRGLAFGAAMTVAAWGCTAPSESVLLCMPEGIDDGVLVRVDRRSEAEHALLLVQKLEAQGLRKPVAAVYEFSFMRNKPLFRFVLGNGAADRASLLDHAIA